MRKLILLMSSVFDHSYCCEQLYSLMRTSSQVQENLDRWMWIATAEIKPDIVGKITQAKAIMSRITDIVREN
jgi:hypothetical protein